MNVEAARQALVGALAAPGADALGNFAVAGDALDTASVFRFDLTSEMAAVVAADLARAVQALVRKQFLPYDPSYQTSPAQVLVEELDAIASLATLDATVRSGDVPDYPGGLPLVAMSHVLGAGSDQVVAHRVKGPGIATRRARWVQLVPREGVYEQLREEVLYYEPRFDVFTCGGYACFTTATLIQTRLQADEKARRLAGRTLAAVTGNVAIEGFDELRRAVVDDPTMRAKLAAIARLLDADPEYAQHLTTERLLAFIRENPAYDLPLGTVDGKPALRFDPSPQHRHQIPKLLADDYLHSRLTERSYEAGSKHRLQG